MRAQPDDGRGRRHRLERRHAGRRRLRHHGAPRGRDRLLLRRRDHPALVVGRARARRAARRARARAEPLVRDPAAAGAAARAARAGRPADRARRRHGLGAAGAARDRGRAGLPRPLPEPLRAGAPRGRPRRAAAVHARLGAGAAARDLRRHRHLARRAARRRGHDHVRRARRLLRLRGLPRHPAPHRGRDRRQGHARATSARTGCSEILRIEPQVAEPSRTVLPSRRRGCRSPTGAPASWSSRGCSPASSRRCRRRASSSSTGSAASSTTTACCSAASRSPALPVEVVRQADRRQRDRSDALLRPAPGGARPVGARDRGTGAGGDRGRERGGRARRAARRARTGSSRSAGARSREASGSGSSSPARCSPTPRSSLLVEPTSAVDAHTEARIARRLREARRGRTTVILTGKPARARPGRARRLPRGRRGRGDRHPPGAAAVVAPPTAGPSRGRGRMSERLPIADGPEVRAHAAALFRRHRRAAHRRARAARARRGRRAWPARACSASSSRRSRTARPRPTSTAWWRCWPCSCSPRPS